VCGIRAEPQGSGMATYAASGIHGDCLLASLQDDRRGLARLPRAYRPIRAASSQEKAVSHALVAKVFSIGLEVDYLSAQPS